MPRILMVDDSKMIRMILRGLLTQLKFNDIIEASNGVEALQAVRENKVDMILLDLHMPQLGGIGVLEELRKNPEYQAIPVIVVSSDTEKNQLEQAKRLGATAYVQKPMRLQGLQQALLLAGVVEESSMA